MASKNQYQSKGKKEENHEDLHDKEQLESKHALYRNVLLEEYIYLKPADLNNKIDDIILQKLIRKVEGKCIKVGYVVPGSIKFLHVH